MLRCNLPTLGTAEPLSTSNGRVRGLAPFANLNRRIERDALPFVFASVPCSNLASTGAIAATGIAAESLAAVFAFHCMLLAFGVLRDVGRGQDRTVQRARNCLWVNAQL